VAGTIRITVNVDPKTSILNRDGRHGEMGMDVNLSELDDRELNDLSTWIGGNGKGGLVLKDRTQDGCVYTAELAAPTMDALKTWLAANRAKLDAEIAKKEQAMVALKAAWEDRVCELAAGSLLRLMYRNPNNSAGNRWGLDRVVSMNDLLGHTVEHAVERLRDDWIPDDARLAPMIAEARQDVGARNSAERAEANLRRDQEQAYAEAAREDGRSKMVAWANEHGSELLKLRLAGGYEWEPLAHQEYADWVLSECPLTRAEEIECKRIDRSSRTTPTIAEIKAVESVRDAYAVAMPPISFSLVWFTYFDDEDGTFSRCEIEAEVTCPDGAEVDRYYLIPDSKA
jgi:hypothetical protein